ncbi:putative transposon, En/Spm-like protein [Tanacetum coccineum]|uniref:Transposon, En/Spm-like protein n=1 Tax=Tanacetum coccineum TaxID=301880 RepID=A0ABQ5AUR7_9ASTR
MKRRKCSSIYSNTGLIKATQNGINMEKRMSKQQLPKYLLMQSTMLLTTTGFNMDLVHEIPTDGPATIEMVNATKDGFSAEDLDKFQELLLNAEKPLYKGCPDFTKLPAIVKLLNLKVKICQKIMRMMGSGYKKIHVCSNNCILYWNDNKELNVCPTCGISRWKVDNKTRKVYENIPAKLGISADWVDVNSGTRHHSVWPVLSVIYNLPPWLCMKRKFIMLSVLISRYPGNDIDVFLEPLVNDLQTLFEKGVETYDAFKKENFNMRAVVLWTINDYPSLGTLCGCPYSGFKGCVVCGKETHCVRLSASSKQSYAGHIRYLPYNHPFRKQKKAFNGQQECQLAPIPLTREQIYNKLEDTRGIGGKIQKQKRKTTEAEGSSSQVTEPYWKKFNIWYRKLKYWRHNSVPHCIDFMHVEKNVGESLVGTLLNVPGKTKDGVNARLDLLELGIKPELFARQDEEKTTLPPAGYTLTNAEKDIFCETLSNIRVPQGYCSNFSSLVNLKDRKLIGLKSHDYHMLMKEISLQELDKLQAELVVTLCLLEKFFPLSFFDIMIHLTVHLTREVKLCGPICFRWMYPFERCMKVIKGHVRNRNRPEGCIAEETIAEETIEFFSEYHKTMKTVGIPPEKHITNENEDGEPLSACKSSEVSGEVFQKAHLRHKQFFKTILPGKRIALLESEHSKSFSKWLREEVERELEISKDSVSDTVRWISYGPRATIVKYEAYNINGYTFRTKSNDGKVYQNSRVSVEAADLHISKEVATTRKAFYYGVLQEIWVLDYRFRQIPLFKCDWVNHKAGGVKHDKYLGYTLIDLNSLGHKGDLFILASQARRVFYVKDQLDKRLSIVFNTTSKNYKDTYDEVDEEFSTVIHEHNHNILPRVNKRDLGNESQDDYYRTDCEEPI